MNHSQTLQTALTIILCITVAFLVGRNHTSGDAKTPTYIGLENSGERGHLAFEKLQQIENRLTRLEISSQSRQSDLQTLFEDFANLQGDIKNLKKQLEGLPSEGQGISTSSWEKLQSELAGLQQVQRDLAQQLENITAQKNTQPETPVAEQEKQQQALEQQAERHFAQVEPKFREHLALRRYADARWIIRFPESLRDTHAGRKAEALLKQIDAQMSSDYESLEIEARRYADRGRVLEAVEMMRSVPTRFAGRTDLAERARLFLEKLEEERERIASDPETFTGTANEEIQGWIAQMADSSPDKVMEAKQQLRHLGSRAEEALLKALDNPSAEIRWGAITLLGKLEGERVENALILGLRDVDTQVKISALEALERLGSVRAIDEIIKVTADENFMVAQRAVKAFESITGHKILFDNIEMTPENISGVREMMALFWEKNRAEFVKP